MVGVGWVWLVGVWRRGQVLMNPPKRVAASKLWHIAWIKVAAHAMYPRFSKMILLDIDTWMAAHMDELFTLTTDVSLRAGRRTCAHVVVVRGPRCSAGQCVCVGVCGGSDLHGSAGQCMCVLCVLCVLCVCGGSDLLSAPSTRRILVFPGASRTVRREARARTPTPRRRSNRQLLVEPLDCSRPSSPTSR